MNQSNLSHTDIQIPELSLGAMSLDFKDEKLASYILDQALDLGINYIDTADMYDKGENEKLIGEITKKNRAAWTIASKVGNKWRADGSGWDWAPSKSYILGAVETSLRNLQTDYIDNYQLHGGTIDDPFDEIIEAFELLKEQGKIKAYGISSIRPNVFLKYAEETNISSNLMQYSLLDRRPEEYLNLLNEAKVAVFVRGALAQGLLIDKPAKKYLEFTEQEVKAAQEAVNAIAKDLEVPALAVALKYPLLHDAVKSVVVGIRTESQFADLKEAIPAMGKLSLSDYERLLNLLPTIRYTDHRK